MPDQPVGKSIKAPSLRLLCHSARGARQTALPRRTGPQLAIVHFDQRFEVSQFINSSKTRLRTRIEKLVMMIDLGGLDRKSNGSA
jgi:hypothetical protein